MHDLLQKKFEETEETQMACLISPLFWHYSYESELNNILNV
jgi:hypothetical protein